MAWDRSHDAGPALAAAVRVAELAGGRVHVVHVLEPAAAMVLPPANPKIGNELRKSRHADAEHDIRAALAAIDPDLDAVIDVRDGAREDQIVAATEKLDVLIVGSSGKGALHRVTSGSVSAHLAHHNHCPVVVVPRGIAVESRA